MQSMPNSPLLPLRLGSDGPALFIVAGLAGTATELLQLGRSMSCGNPVYCLQARGLDGAEAPLDSVETMAQYCLAAIREHQPEGPYLLAGYSFGGLVALEMAQRLIRSGERPPFLAFLESYTHPQHWPFSARFGVVAGIARQRAAMLLRSPPREIAAYVATRARAISARKRADARETAGDPTFRWFHHAPTTSEPLPVQRVFEASVIAFRRYKPQPYAGKIVFFQPRDRSNFPKSPRRMWRKLASDVDVQKVAGDHRSMVGADAADLAARLRLCISRALDENA